MSDKPEIEKLRVLHDLQTQFSVPVAMHDALRSQLSAQSQEHVERFVRGFRIEDWFEWIFCPMPWVKLIHGLDQQQFPKRSKEEYQVPDFLMLVETSALQDRPLLVEVKRVPKAKQTLKLQDTQVLLSERYATVVKIPLVYAVYWESFGLWTLNTPDSFETKSSTRKLSMMTAIELDGGAVLGDVSHVVPPGLVRRSRFSKRDVASSHVRHDTYGALVFDTVRLGGKQVDLTTLESAAIDALLAMKRRSENDLGNGVTEIIEMSEDCYVLKLSTCIMRHLAIFSTEPSDKSANVSANVVADLLTKLGCPVVHLFPTDGTPQLRHIDTLFRTSAPAAI